MFLKQFDMALQQQKKVIQVSAANLQMYTQKGSRTLLRKGSCQRKSRMLKGK